MQNRLLVKLNALQSIFCVFFKRTTLHVEEVVSMCHCYFLGVSFECSSDSLNDSKMRLDLVGVVRVPKLISLAAAD